ncbi:MAG: SpoIIE family protein phosphatase [Calditrichaceae bacterium]
MQYTQFRVQDRINDYIQNLKTMDSLNTRFIINACVWWISFFLTFGFLETGNDFGLLFLIVYYYFWFSLNKDLLKRFTTPVEILLVIILVFSIIDFSILNSSDALITTNDFSVFIGWSFSGIVHKFFLSFIVLFFGLLLIQNSKRRQGVLIIYSIFFLIGHYGFFYGHTTFLIIFQIFIFFSLMKRTVWLESLTRIELIIYFALLLWTFLVVTEPSFVNVIKNAGEENQLITYSLPFFIYILINLYLLALLVRIPIVVIYNHASLARKLKIAGLFQSSFPLFIQMIALLVIFFLFISGWQAGKLRDRFIQVKDKALFQSEIKIDPITNHEIIEMPGYKSVDLTEDLPAAGVISVQKTNVNSTDHSRDYFFFQQEFNNVIKYAKIDEEFLKQISANLELFAGNGLVAYTHEPRKWVQYFSDIDLVKTDLNINTNPFALIYPLAEESGYSSDRIICNFPNVENDSTKWNWNLYLLTFRNPLVIMGRLTIPLINAANPKHSSFLVDIYFDLRSIFQWNFVTQIALGLIVVFFIFNFLIIRRVVSFGEQITASVVQKFDVLKNGIREVSSGNLDYKVELEGEDEFVELAGRFNQMGVRLQDTIEEVREKDRLDQELKIARQVQLSLLKTELPEINGFHIAADLQTATEVGGDFYDIIPLDKHRFIFSVGDVSGKGSSAAFYMAQFMSVLRYSPGFIEDPKEIAIRLNKYMMSQISDRQIFITAIIGMLDTSKNEIKLARAGHNLPIFISPNSKNVIREIDSSGLGIGLSKSDELFSKSLKLHKFKIKSGEKLFLYTDGIIEARRPAQSINSEVSEEIYGEERLNDLIFESIDLNAEELMNVIIRGLDAFYGEHPRIDDFTMMIIEKE